jgi:GNAT superfamily N-acetyltransferase
VNVTVRVATEPDVPALLALYGQLHPSDANVPAERAHRVWRAISGQWGRTILVAERDGCVVGTADCLLVPNLTHGCRPYLQVENVVVAEAARRGGVGSGLIHAATAAARAAGCYKIQLQSRVDRLAAHTFYESCGLTATATGYRRYLDRD